MTRIDRIKNLIKDEFGDNQAEFARAIKKAPAQVNQWLNGYRNIGDGVARNIEEILNKPARWLDGKNSRPIESNAKVIGTVDTWDSNTPLENDDCEVPFYFYKETHLAARNSFADDINDYKLRFSKSTLRRQGINPTDVVCVSADGNSMEPVFPSGATLGINTADKVIKDGKIYAFNNGGLFKNKNTLSFTGQHGQNPQLQ
ncbi:LexA family transcriptional regulator [Neisseria iguanae]|uniref:LexA family transcriptional regulator n=1 Tax=Neisseria iguanae TaxID=90242 RepID=UPI001FE551DE|nr:S24 family peptidase [Neisseria iguanae]